MDEISQQNLFNYLTHINRELKQNRPYIISPDADINTTWEPDGFESVGADDLGDAIHYPVRDIMFK